MATITLTKTISAEHLTRTITALKAHYAMPANATNAQVQAEFDKEVWAFLKARVLAHEAGIAAKAAAAGVTEIALT